MKEKSCTTEEKVYLTVQEVSEYLKIKTKTLYAMASAGEIPHYRIGRLLRFKKQDIETWVETKKVTAQAHRIGTKQPAGKNVSDVDQVIRKAIDATKGGGYNTLGKSDHVKGLRKEVKNGTI